MKIQTDREGEKLNVKLSGKLDTVTAPSLQEVMDQELEGVKYVQIDFAEVEYVSSAGLRVLLSASKKLTEQEKKADKKEKEAQKEAAEQKGKKELKNVRVLNVSDKVMDVLYSTGFDKILTIL